MELSKVFPIYKVENNLILSRQGDITAGFKIQLPEIYSLSKIGFEKVHSAWVKVVGLLPEKTILHKQDWFVNNFYRGDFGRDRQSFHAVSSERFLSGRPHLEHTCHLFVTKRPSGIPLGTSAVSNLLRKSLLSPVIVQTKEREEFLHVMGQFKQILLDIGMGVQAMTGVEIAGTSHRKGVLESYLSLGDSLLLEDVQFKPEFRIGSKYVQLYGIGDVDQLPGTVNPMVRYEPYSSEKEDFPIGFPAPISGLLSCNHLYNQFVFVEDSKKKLKTLESKRRRLESLSTYSRENAISRDATESFLNEALSHGKKAVKAHFNVMVWTDNRAELGHLGNLTASAFAKMNVVPKLETMGAPQLFWAGLPGNQASFPVNESFDTFIGQAVSFFNLETNYRTSTSPIGIRLGDRITGYPIHVDISDEPISNGLITNRNKFVLGPSGSGKSFFTNHMMRTYFEQGAHVVLVDVGHSYKGLCNLVNGYYFTYEESAPISFNPFFISDRRRPDTEKKESLKTLLYALWKKEDETYKRSEYVALSNALTGYFEWLESDHQVFPCFDSFYEFLDRDFREVLEKDRIKVSDFDVDNFMYVLRPYYKDGEFDYLLNARNNLNLLEQRFIVFELDTIKDHPILFPVVTLMIMEIFISKMRKLKGIRKIILIEEAWKAIAKEGMAEYIRYLFKTVRKFFGEAIVVTQEVEDIVSSPIIKQAIINNADVKILLDQSKYQNKFDEVQSLLGLTEQEKSIVLSMNKAKETGRNYKEVYLSPYKKVYRVEVSLEEYLTYTTEEKEKLRVEEYARKYGGYKEGIQMLANEIRTNQKG
ncbi:TraG family conjugative transposon ATPase [Algoriphagus aestuarii]|nr:TraG family conjugative transposon ATPase [Algoriphagus aestuarii]